MKIGQDFFDIYYHMKIITIVFIITIPECLKKKAHNMHNFHFHHILSKTKVSASLLTFLVKQIFADHFWLTQYQKNKIEDW